MTDWVDPIGGPQTLTQLLFLVIDVNAAHDDNDDDIADASIPGCCLAKASMTIGHAAVPAQCTCCIGTEGSKLKVDVVDWASLDEMTLPQEACVQVLCKGRWQGQCVAQR